MKRRLLIVAGLAALVGGLAFPVAASAGNDPFSIVTATATVPGTTNVQCPSGENPEGYGYSGGQAPPNNVFPFSNGTSSGYTFVWLSGNANETVYVTCEG
jgi:hypothetical protein